MTITRAQDIQDTLVREAQRADVLIIWTDCDREGENIGDEIRQACALAVFRFSAIALPGVSSCKTQPAGATRTIQRNNGASCATRNGQSANARRKTSASGRCKAGA